MKLFKNDAIYTQYAYEKEADFEQDVVRNSKLFFGGKSIYIAAKKMIKSAALGNTIPDGFLFDISDTSNPAFYLVEVELAKHDFYRHIFPQITKFLNFFKHQVSRTELVEKIFNEINSDDALKAEFRKTLGQKEEIYKFLMDTIEKSQNILLILDEEKNELPEIMDTYNESWGKMVSPMYIKKFIHGRNEIYSMHPEFEVLEFAGIVAPSNNEEQSEIEYTEEYHLDGIDQEIVAIWQMIKSESFRHNSQVQFIPRKHYIAIHTSKRVAYVIFRKKKINLIILHPENETRKLVKHYAIKSLSKGVQTFWNAECCEVNVSNDTHLIEIIKLIELVMDKHKQIELMQ